MVKLKPLTSTSWLVLADDGMQHVALLSEQKDKLVLIAKNIKTVFNNRKELQEFFAEDIFKNVIVEESKEKVEYFVKGYSVDYDKPIEADPTKITSSLPLYTKTLASDVYYAAGFYCLNFPKNWMPGFCPKLSTLEKYGYEGPFRTKKEMKFVLSKLRKCPR